MKVAELLELLEGLPEDAEVRFAHNPAWAFEFAIADVALHAPEALGYEPADGFLPPDEPVVYLVEGEQLGYLPGDVAREIGWK